MSRWLFERKSGLRFAPVVRSSPDAIFFDKTRITPPHGDLPEDCDLLQVNFAHHFPITLKGPLVVGRLERVRNLPPPLTSVRREN